MPEQSPRMVWPYPTAEDDPWFDTFVDHVNAMDASGYASREDRHAILGEGGSVDWTAPTLTWAGTIVLTAPITGFLWRVPAGNIDIADGETLYATLSRAPGQNVNVPLAASSTVPSNNDTIAIATRIGDRLYFRNGLLLNNTDSVTNLGSGQGAAGSGSPRTAKIVVGNVGAGDVAADADFLDTGDGVQLAAALAAATSGQDVYLRPGTYDLGAGAATPPLSVPAGVTLRGAGPSGAVIRTRADGNMSAIEMGAASKLKDVGIEVALPTGPGNTADYVVNFTGDLGVAERVRVTFLGVYANPQATNLFLRGVFSIANEVTRCKIIDPEIVSAPSLRANGVAADLIGFRVVGGTVANQYAAFIERPVAFGLDISAALRNRGMIVNPSFEDMDQLGIEVSTDASRSLILGGEVRNVSAGGTWVGIRLLNAVAKVRVTDTAIDSGASGQSCVFFDGTVNRCSVKGVTVETGGIGLELGASTTRNQAIACILNGAATPISDAGTLNDVLAHNITA